MKHHIKFGVKWLWYLMVAMTVLLALALLIVKELTPRLEVYQEDLSVWFSSSLGEPVEIKALSASWYGAGPAFSLDQVKVGEAEAAPTVSVRRLVIGFSFLDVLLRQEIRPRHIVAHGVEVRAKETPAGQWVLFQNRVKGEGGNFIEILKTIEALNSIQVDQASLHLTKQSQEVKSLTNLSLTLARQDYYTGISLELPGISEQDADVRLEGSVRGSWLEPHKMVSEWYLRSKSVPVDQLGTWLAFAADWPKKNTVDLELWSKWQGKSLLNAQGTLGLFAPTHVLSSNFSWEREAENRWLLTGDELLVSGQDKTGAPSQFRVHYFEENDKESSWLVNSSLLHLEGMAEFIQVFTGISETRWHPEGVKVTGVLRDLSLEIDIATEEGKPYRILPSSHIYAVLDDVDVAVFQGDKKEVALSGISGVAESSLESGSINLTSGAGELEAPAFFDEKVKLAATKGGVQWRQAGESWQVQSRALRVALPDTQLSAAFDILVPKSIDQAQIEMRVEQMSPLDAQKVKAYLPLKLMKQNLGGWLTEAMQAGTFSEGRFVWRGTLAQAPYDTGDGTLEAGIKWQGGTLYYHPDWPLLTDIDASLHYHGRKFNAVVNSAKSLGLVIGKTEVSIPKIVVDEEIRLTVQGEAETTLASAKTYIQASPLWKYLSKELSPLKLKGSMALKTGFALSLDDAHDYLSVQGEISTAGSEVILSDLDLTFEDVKGCLQFTQEEVTANQLEARLFKKPIQISIFPSEKDGSQRYRRFVGTGAYDVDTLRAKLPHPLWLGLSGQTQLTAEWRAYEGRSEDSRLLIDSELRGIVSSLPAPLAKDSDQKLPLHLQFLFPKPGEIRAELSLGGELKSYWLSLEQELDKSSSKGVLLLGKQLKTYPLQEDSFLRQYTPGVHIKGSLPVLDVSAWQSVVEQLQAGSAPQPEMARLPIQSVALFLDKFQVGEQTFEQLDLQATNQGDKWRATLDSGLLAGTLTISDSLVDGNFKRCLWQPDESKGAEKQDWQINQVPSMNIHCDQAIWGKLPLGSVDLKIRQVKEGLELSGVRVLTPNYDLVLKGLWQEQQKVTRSGLQGEVRFKDFARLAQSFDFQSEIKDASGTIIFDVVSDQSLPEISLASLSGRVAINLLDGRFSDVETRVGRFISLLSFHNLQRRLRLDFSDVFKDGYVFDYLKGDFLLKNGVAVTDNLEIDGSSAYITVKGELNLVNESLALDMIVMPHVTGTFPLAATVATGNPAIGAAVWFVDKLFSSETRKLAKYRYKITGSIDQPAIELGN